MNSEDVTRIVSAIELIAITLFCSMIISMCTGPDLETTNRKLDRIADELSLIRERGK